MNKQNDKDLSAVSPVEGGRRPSGTGGDVFTLKENLLWVRRFDTVEELRLALLEFKETYNLEWIGDMATRLRQPSGPSRKRP